jgi:hypothetical protein
MMSVPTAFNPPAEADWHRMISEAAYFIAEQRGFVGEDSLAEWLAAEEQVRRIISP